MLTSEILRAARGLIDTPEKWHQGYYYPLDESGTDWEDDKPWRHSPARYCALGACGIATADDPYAACGNESPAYRALLAVLPAGFFGIVAFNDGSTHADVMALFDRAIAHAEADESEPTPNADTLTTVMAACDGLAGTVADAIIQDRPDRPELDRAVVLEYCAAELFCAAQDCAQMFTLSMDELAALRATIRDSLERGA